MTTSAPARGSGDRSQGTEKRGPGPRASNPILSLRIRETVPAWLATVLGILPIAALLFAWFVVTAG